MNQRIYILLAISMSTILQLSAVSPQVKPILKEHNLENGLTELRDSNGIQGMDQFILSKIEEYAIPGAALAIIQEGKLIHKNFYGYANLEHRVPVHENTTFSLYSLTKPIISAAVFKLQEEGYLKLEDKIAIYLDDLPSSWGEIRVKHLLAQTSGLPDMFGSNPLEFRDLNENEAQARVYKLPVKFKAGDRFDYVQTNSWLLKRIIEICINQQLEDFIRTTQFENTDKEHMYFSCDARDIIVHRATSYFPWIKNGLVIDLPYTNGDYLIAANGLHLSLEAMIEWDKRLTNGDIVSMKSLKKMRSTYPYDRDDTLFGYGWGVYFVKGFASYGFSGSMATNYRYFPQDKISVILLTNGFTHNYSQNKLIEQIYDMAAL